MFLFASVVQAGIVALGLLGVSPQLPRSGAASRFPVSVIRVLAVEGGYVEHRVDPGGATKHGVTRARLAQHRGRPVTKAEVRGLTIAEAVAIYRTLYWDALAADELPPGVDHALFDFAVHSGVPRRRAPCSAPSASPTTDASVRRRSPRRARPTRRSCSDDYAPSGAPSCRGFPPGGPSAGAGARG